MEIDKKSHAVTPCTSFCIRCPKQNRLTINKRISLSHDTQTVNIDGKKIKFSNRAFRVLCALMHSNGTPLSSRFLSEYAWPDCIVVKNNLVVMISEIRTTLRYTDIKINNIRGFGYQLTLPVNNLNLSNIKEGQC